MMRTLLAVLIAGGIPLPCLAGNATDFTATVTAGGTCTMQVTSPSIQLGSGTGFAPVAAISKSWVGLSKTDFTLQLRSCSGLADPNKTPVITTTGNTLAGGGGNRLFSTGSNTTGFGVVVYNVPATQATDGDTSKIVTKGGAIAIPGFGKGTVVNANTDVPLSAAVACGTESDCAPNKVTPGDIAATVTFTFLYQ